MEGKIRHSFLYLKIISRIFAFLITHRLIYKKRSPQKKKEGLLIVSKLIILSYHS